MSARVRCGKPAQEHCAVVERVLNVPHKAQQHVAVRLADCRNGPNCRQRQHSIAAPARNRIARCLPDLEVRRNAAIPHFPLAMRLPLVRSCQPFVAGQTERAGLRYLQRASG
jgi:hypothetical protein